MPLKPWKILAEKTAFANRWWKIVQETVELPDGSIAEDYFVNHAGNAVVVFALTKDGNVLLNRQYKHGAREIIEELTIGRMDDDDGDPVEAAKRELLEETGYSGGTWEELAVLISNPTSSTARLHAFLARGVKKIAEPKQDPREIVEAAEIDPKEFVAKIRRGDLKSHAALAAIFLAFERLRWIEFKV